MWSGQAQGHGDDRDQDVGARRASAHWKQTPPATIRIAGDLRRVDSGCAVLALAVADYGEAADVFSLLLLTGSRKSEALGASWDQINLTDGIWTKPGSATKQKTDHQVPLSAPARQLLERDSTIATRPRHSSFRDPARASIATTSDEPGKQSAKRRGSPACAFTI
jgi:integrase